MNWIDIITGIFISIGCVFGIIGGIGMHRLPDFYSRLHAGGLTDTLCSFMILCGLALQAGLTLAAAKLLLIFLFLFFTSPTASYSLATNAWQYGLRPQGTPSQPRTSDGGQIE
ncbi:monovalent cation/H(+) antiporter subunit G [Aestuariibacter halophilus]|uniref:Monovalent cation/H(+) antiporter subunit G n=1 Tax=Fluctibacter halophilus TaxID=226011 RepID=A0ABS8G6W5_9ALTE|nr:monovalent cation/H(+) antiporter subunit G [Aestuariibacter halophilus]MCC2616268.1 monovalent cation/H(+) antiporter subunit G [Aestuariibacter halophilus]